MSDQAYIDSGTILHLRKDDQDFLLPVMALVQCLEIAIADGCVPPLTENWLSRVLPVEYRIANLNDIPHACQV